MMKLNFFLILFIYTFHLFGQGQYSATLEYPFGQINPEAPSALSDYELLIGICDCESSKLNADNVWAKPQKMIWKFKYIMNGTAVQDESIKEDGSHTGSIRQFIPDSSKWYVHWYSSNSPSSKLPTWEGGKRGDTIILYKSQKSPNGKYGFYKITFKNISLDGFNWIGEWIDTTETIILPTWRINCRKRKLE